MFLYIPVFKSSVWTGEMTQQIKTLAALSEDLLEIVPAPTFQLTTVCNSSPKGPRSFLGFLGHQAHTWFIDLNAGKTFTHTQ